MSCDMAGVRAEWVDILLAHRTEQARAVAFGSERWDPLFALYRSDLLPEVEAHLRRGERAMWRLLEAAQAVAVPHPANWHLARSINTPADLQQYLDALEARSSR